MPTPFANDQLTAYLDGELDHTEAAALEQELARNPVLQAELEQLEAVTSLLRVHGPVSAPPDFFDQVMAAVEEEDPAPGFWDWLRRPFGLRLDGLALALTAAAVLWMILPSKTAPNPDAVVTDLPVPTATPARDDGTVGVAAPRQAAPPAAGDAEAPEPAPTPPPEVQDEGKVTAKKGSAEGVDAPEPAEEQAGEPVEEPPTEPGAADERPVLQTRWSYTIYADSDRALSDLLRIAGQHRGEVYDQSGAPIRDGRMSSSDMVVMVHLPNTELTGFSRDLKTTMMEVQTDLDEELIAGTEARIGVRLKVVGDPGQSDQYKRPAARKMQLDDVKKAR